MLEITDRIYGTIRINDPVILSLINTPVFQRLKNINQYGGVNLVFPNYQVSRYEHSIGVWWTLKSLNVSEEVQVNGLLHDIAHSAFSHMVDMARSDENENFHEDAVSDLALMAPVHKILNKNNIKLVNPDEYPEIKRPLPDIGADRIDYALRDYFGAIGKNTLFGKDVLNNLIIIDRNIIFKNADVAKKYSSIGLDAMWKVIYDPKVAVVYQSIIEIIKFGFRDGWIKNKDLMEDDAHLMQLFKKNRDKFPEKYLKIFEVPFRAVIVSDKEKYDFIHTKLKIRYFDPQVNTVTGVKRLSEIDPDFADLLRKKVDLFEKRKTGICIRVDFNDS